jgi:hypothetical protein
MDTLNQNESNPSSPTKSTIPINPIEECFKAIGIVHGAAAEQHWRYVFGRIKDIQDAKLNAIPWTADRVQYILDNEIKYKDWRFVVGHLDVWENGGWDTLLYLRAEWMGADAETGNLEKQQSRKWFLDKHMVKTEVIQTAFLCVLKAEEHEIREGFKYKGKAPFNSHIDIDTLAVMSDNVDVRTDPRPEAPKNQRRE